MKNSVTITEKQVQEIESIIASVKAEAQEITKPYQITKEIKPRQKAAFVDSCKKAEKSDLWNMTKDFFASVYPTFSTEAKKAINRRNAKGDKPMLRKVLENLYALALSGYSVGHADNVFDYFAEYASFKAESFIRFNDLGAISDLIETAVHCIASRELWRVKLYNLHVSDMGKIDVKINRIKWECGTNGKSFMESTEADYMHGKYSAIMYGVFNEEEENTLCEYFTSGKTFEGLTYVAKRLYVWEDKNAFVPFCNKLAKRSALEWNASGNYARFRYNNGTDKAFRREAKAEGIKTLYEYMKALSENDFLLND